MISGIETKALFEASEEHAGEMVGYVNAHKLEESDTFRFVVGHATVGENGAFYGTQFSSEGEQFSDVSRGFVGATAISLYANNPDRIEITSVQSPFHNKGYRQQEYTDIFLSFFPKEKPAEGVGEWALTDAGIVDAIKRRLEELDMLAVYPAIYYDLAVLATKPLADPTMASQTLEIRAHVDKMAGKLKEMSDEDKGMLENLTVFGNIPALELPEAFVRSREKVGITERTLNKDVPRFAHGWIPSVGFRPSGRTWPYMDPECADADRSYGWVLQTLRNKDVTLAEGELKKEVDELRLRDSYAERTLLCLRELAAREHSLLAEDDTINT